MMLPRMPIRCLSPAALRTSRVKSATNAFFIVRSLSLQSTSPSATAKPYSEIPMPPRSPLLGNIGAIAKRTDGTGRYALIEEFSKVLDEYGGICKIDYGILFGEEVMFSNPLDAIVLFRNEGKLPTRWSKMENGMKNLHKSLKISPFLFFSSGNDWKKIRTSMSKQLLPQRMAYFIPALYRSGDDLISTLYHKQKEHGIIEDIRPFLHRWALKSVTTFLFDEDFEVFDDQDPFTAEICAASMDFIKAVTTVLKKPPLQHVYKSKRVKQYEAAIARMKVLGQKVLESKFNAIKSGDASTTTKIKHSVLEQVLADGLLTEDEAIAQVCDSIAAGVDTTSTSGTLLVHEIAKNPGIQTSLREEVIRIVGDDQPPSFEQLQSLSLVRSTVRENMRLNPPVFSLWREPKQDIVLSGYHIPAGTKCVYNIRYSGRIPELFPNPLKFDPHRWKTTPSDVEYAFANMPFGFGPRMCYGRRLAELEMQLLLVKLAQRGKVESDQRAVQFDASTIIQAKEPVRIKLIPW